MATNPGTDQQDFILGTNTADTLSGGFSSDQIFGLAGDDILSGGFQNDTINGDVGSDAISGGSGSDNIQGGAGADSINAGTGDDMIMAWGPADSDGDVVDGGLGFDTLSLMFEDDATALTFVAPDPIAQSTLAGGIKVTNVEQFMIVGTNFADTITGGRGMTSSTEGLATTR
ncbi:calcium-binding protein [Sinorhizobium fredii]|uniref:calcium-binding protein n=1 Tax=Rhizobium fredii TaxID=380 RepID=UPI000A6605F1|nr:hypothetical protein [Sinorhizobium fredii]WOS61710.1 hypothetical protein SFGR64A_12190 [Sinorhizobium fredii GR64]